LLIINGAAEALRFELPPGAWFLHIDTAGGDCLNRRLNDAETLAPGSLWLASAAPASSEDDTSSAVAAFERMLSKRPRNA
jgi:hypothetical protein